MGFRNRWSASLDLPKKARVGYYVSLIPGRFRDKQVAQLPLPGVPGDQRYRSQVVKHKKMQPFRVLEHTADIGFEAFGATREQVFGNAARALMYLMVELESIQPREELSLRA